MTFDATQWRSLIDNEVIRTAADIPDSVVDDFEREDPLDDYDGNTGEWGVETANPLEGEQSIKTESESASGSQIRLTDVSNAPFKAIPKKGDRFSVLWKFEDGFDDFSFYFGHENNDDTYQIEHNNRSSELRLNVRDSGSASEEDTDGMSLSTNQLYETEIEWESDDTISATVYEIDENEWDPNDEEAPAGRESAEATVSTTDSTHENREGYALGGGGDTGDDRIVDYIAIWERDI